MTEHVGILGWEQCELWRLPTPTEIHEGREGLEDAIPSIPPDQWNAFLANASAILLACTDCPTALSRAAGLPVPLLADICLVDLFDKDGTVREWSVAHAEPQREASLRELRRRFGPAFSGKNGAISPALRALPDLCTETSSSWFSASAMDPEHHATLRDLGIVSSLVMPLVARGKNLGTMTLWGTGSRRFTLATVALAGDYVRRAALALDNMRRTYEAQEAAFEREEYLSVVAHELKTPLTSLHLYLQILLESARDGAFPGGSAGRSVDALRAAERQSKRLGKLMNDLLDASRISSFRLEIVPQKISLSQLLRESVSTFLAASSRHEVVLDAGDFECHVNGDRARLEQVVVNLLDNAVKYSPDGGTIRVSLVSQGAEAVLSVSDQGIGIPREEQVRLFDRFFRGTNLPRRCTGLGLGLFICREITSSHRGRIWVQSELGSGSTFFVALPALDNQAHVERALRPRVLVVDDDEFILDAVGDLLERQGYDVLRAHDGAQALERVGESRPDLILLDLSMPVMDGGEFVERLRDLDGCDRIPVVVFSARQDVATIAHKLHVAGYLTKPVDARELARVVGERIPSG